MSESDEGGAAKEMGRKIEMERKLREEEEKKVGRGKVRLGR